MTLNSINNHDEEDENRDAVEEDIYSNDLL